MIDNSLDIIILIITGFSSGLFIGSASGTAGVFMLPIVTIALRKDIHDAIGTSLLLDCIIGGIAGLIFLKKGNVNLKSTGILALCAVTGALIGSNFTSHISEGYLLLITALFLIIFGINFIINGVRKNIDFIDSKVDFSFLRKNRFVVFILGGFLVGFFSGFSGIGGGGIIAIALVLIFKYEVHSAIGTSLLLLSAITGAGSIVHIINNEFLINGIIFAGFSAAFGAVLGSSFANKIDEDKLGRLIGVIVVIMGIAVLFRMFFTN